MSDLKWWETAIIYQIYPRSFQDSNSDGIGDLQGITSRLDYISNLGVDAIWISPFFKSPQKDFGYDVSDYFDIAPEYGDLKDLERLISKAHALKLKVMLDIVAVGAIAMTFEFLIPSCLTFFLNLSHSNVSDLSTFMYSLPLCSSKTSIESFGSIPLLHRDPSNDS